MGSHETVIPGHGGDFFVSFTAFGVFGEETLVLCCHDFLEIRWRLFAVEGLRRGLGSRFCGG